MLSVSREAVHGVALLTPWEGLSDAIMSGLFAKVSSHCQWSDFNNTISM